LDKSALERLALRYAERYATTRARLAAYLRRKLRERGWSGEDAPPIESVVARMTALNYVDDRAFATARAASLGRRGLGERRVTQDLRAAGVAEEDSAEARAESRTQAWTAAIRFAERRKFGPFAAVAPERAGREKALAAMLRAGHPLDLARTIILARPGETVEPVDT